MTTYLAITRGDVADYVDTLAIVYLVLIFIRILTSWIPRMPYNRYLSAFLKFISDVTDPYLNLFRRFIPMVRMGPGALDLSPIIATIVLIVVSSLIAARSGAGADRAVVSRGGPPWRSRPPAWSWRWTRRRSSSWTRGSRAATA